MMEILAIVAIFLAVGIGLASGFKIYKEKPAILLLLLFALTGIPDVVITSYYAYLHPEMEGNPLTAVFLSFPYGIVIGTVLWAFGWILLAEIFMRLNWRILAYFTLLTLFAGHLLGTLTWADNIKTGDIRYLSLVMGAGYAILFYAGTQLWNSVSGPGTQSPSGKGTSKPKARGAPRARGSR